MAMPIRKTKKTKDAKPKQSVSDTKRELAMQARATGKKVGPKATLQRMTAKQLGKSIKKQDKSAAKRGGIKPAGPGYKSKGTDREPIAVGIRTSTPYNRIKRINMSKKPIEKRAKR